MKILEALQERIPETGSLLRATLVDAERDAARASAVLIRVPPLHRFPFHSHPRSEDCFFVLSGGGEVFGPGQSYAVPEVAGVWVPPGVPHGLAAGPLGVVEIGFQAPPGPTVDSTAPSSPPGQQRGIAVAALPRNADSSEKAPAWRPVFVERPGWQCLDPHYCFLEQQQHIRAAADGYDLFIVVVRGAVHLSDAARRLDAITVLQLAAGEAATLHAAEANTLLLGVRVSTSSREDRRQ